MGCIPSSLYVDNTNITGASETIIAVRANGDFRRGSNAMSLRENWRYTNIKRLEKATFRFATYTAPSPDWDHDHCCGCWAKFANFDGPEILHRGYLTAIPSKKMPKPEFIMQCEAQGMTCLPQPVIDGDRLYWVCPDCFEDFRDLLGFELVPA